MTTFTSKADINRSASDIYSFLADFNNHQQLMPDNIQDWTATFNEASFSIQNMANLSLQIAERVDNRSIKIIATGKPPFDVQLGWDILPNGDGATVTFTITADLNMMLKMMASGPLQKLAEHETQRLAAILS